MSVCEIPEGSAVRGRAVSRRRTSWCSGFTLIELLMVIMIIAVLAALLIPVAASIRTNAMIADTGQRMDNVTRSLSQLGLNEQGPRQAIQRAANLGGVYTFAKSADVNARVIPNAADGSAWLVYDNPVTLAAPTPAWRLRFPWGRTRLYFGDNPQTAAVEVDATIDRTPQALSLSRLNPRLSQTLLGLAEVFPAAGSDATYPTPVDAYARNRSAKAPWNDRWGNPLIVSCAFYQYGPYKQTAAGTNTDPGYAEAAPPVQAAENLPYDIVANTTGATNFGRQRRMVLDRYQYESSIYLTVGAIGPKRPAALSQVSDLETGLTGSLSSTLDTLWAQITTIANQDDSGTDLWKVDYSVSPAVNAFDQPPWQGLRKATRSGFTCLLTAPMELK